MNGARSKDLTPERRAELDGSFARSVAEPETTAIEAETVGLGLASYKAIRGRWQSRGGTWPASNGKAARPMRAGVRRALQLESAATEPPRAAPARAAAPRAAAGLEPLIVLTGEMITTALTALLGWLLKAAPDDVATVSQPDVDGRKRLEEVAGPLAAYLDSRFGSASEHAPLIAFGLAIGGGVCARGMVLKSMTRARKSSEAGPYVDTTRGPAPQPSAASSSVESLPPVAAAAAGS